MLSKWRLSCCVVIAVFLNTLFVFKAESATVPASCPKPDNAVPIKFPQLLGVWHYQAMVTDEPPKNDGACSRIEFVRTGNKTAFVSGSQYSKSTGNSSHSYGPVKVQNSEVIVTDSIDIPNTVFYSYPIVLNDNAIVYSTCVFTNNQLVSKNVAVLTRNQSPSRKDIDELLSKANINVATSNVNYTDNYPECFTLTCHRKSE